MVLTIEGVDYPFGDRLYVGEQLKRGQGLISQDRRIRLVLQNDNRLAILAPFKALPWSTETQNFAVESASLTEKGLTLLDDKNTAVYTSGFLNDLWKPDDGNYLLLKNDGDLVLWFKRQEGQTGSMISWISGECWNAKSGHFKPEESDFAKFVLKTIDYPVTNEGARLTELTPKQDFSLSETGNAFEVSLGAASGSI